MPGVRNKANKLMHRFYDYATKTNQPKIKEVIDIYRRGTHVNYKTVENTVIGLYSPSLIGKHKADRMYDDYMKKHGEEEAYDIAPRLLKLRDLRMKLDDTLARLRASGRPTSSK